MSKRLFTSDPHVGHILLSAIRGFASVEEHNEVIIERWNNTVGVKDTVFVAGDAVMGRRSISLQLYTRMNGIKHLITGNHDDCWSGHPNSWAKHGEYKKVFASIQPFLQVTIDGQLVLISHFPYTADSIHRPQYNQYRLRDEGNWLLHGHTHSSVRRTSAREIHIGMDAWDLTPVAETRIVAMMRAQLAQERNGEGNATLSPSDIQVPPATAAPSAPVIPGDAQADSGAPGAPGHHQ